MSRSLPRPASAPPPPVRRGQLVEARETRSADGTNIAYFVGPEPYPGAPVVVLANGLGGPRLAWRGLVEQLSDEVRFVTWDYRGLYASSRPSDSSDLAYSVPRQVDDLEAVLRAEGIGRATLFGWSMGVQVALEAYRRLPGFAEALVLLNGTFGRPLDTAVPLPFARRFVPPVLQVAERLHQPVGKVMRALAAQPEFVSVMKRFGMMADTVDEGEFTEIAVAFAGLDVEVFLRTLRALGDHDASRILPRIEVPVLVVAGDHDRMTPRGLSQQMVRKIPRAEILVVRGGTHYTAVEFPELVALRIGRFLREQGIAG